MEYKITILNTLAVGGMIYFIADYVLKNNDPSGLGLLALIYVVVAAFCLLGVDFAFQYFIKNYWAIIGVEALIVGIVGIWIASTQREKVLLIPEDFGEGNITIIYGMENAKKLPIGLLTWRYEVKIPQDGVLLTATKFEDDLPQTDVKTYAGVPLAQHEEGLSFGCLYESELDCGHKKYKYRTWIVQKNGCEFSSVKADSMQIVLQNTYCK